ncbi:MAG: hypothetical protein ACKOOF_04275 [Planctomycetaceae bacterium]
MFRHPRSTARTVILAALFVAAAAPACPAIEMFTYFGDGSRIGLPSLEVPIEAYPGIPLRSDRIRARRRAIRGRPAAQAPETAQPKGMPSGMTIRVMPEPVPPAPAP